MLWVCRYVYEGEMRGEKQRFFFLQFYQRFQSIRHWTKNFESSKFWTKKGLMCPFYIKIQTLSCNKQTGEIWKSQTAIYFFELFELLGCPFKLLNKCQHERISQKWSFFSPLGNILMICINTHALSGGKKNYNIVCINVTIGIINNVGPNDAFPQKTPGNAINDGQYCNDYNKKKTFLCRRLDTDIYISWSNSSV